MAIPRQSIRLVLTPLRFHASPLCQLRPRVPQIRPQSTATTRSVETSSSLQAIEQIASASRNPEFPVATESSSTPWYLREQASVPQAAIPSHIAERQKIPDLPSYPPTILEPSLEYISKDLGLDYLSVLDLRALDPPAALGGNLIMVFGTARSEKHLHVSADRFCRWLRTNYKLRPNADGLLGRNEIKLKLRRKAKRSRMLAAAGSVDQGDPDDGIKTGWVCVNVGEVDPHPESVEAQNEGVATEGFVGFGSSSNKVSIVIQMFTEEKRAEIELEQLWADHLERSKRRVSQIAPPQKVEAEEPFRGLMS